jgi:hypothetical protein
MIVTANIRAEQVYLCINAQNGMLAFTKNRAEASEFTDKMQAAIACTAFSLKFNVANPRVE